MINSFPQGEASFSNTGISIGVIGVLMGANATSSTPIGDQQGNVKFVIQLKN